MYQVKGKWALITGAARGIGYLAAQFMASHGCNLILHSRDLAHTEKVLSEVRALGVEAAAVAADLNDLCSVERMLAEIDAMGIDVDIVLNNAGLQVAYRTDLPCHDLLSLPAKDDCPGYRTDPEYHQRYRTGCVPGRVFRQQSGAGQDYH